MGVVSETNTQALTHTHCMYVCVYVYVSMYPLLGLYGI